MEIKKECDGIRIGSIDDGIYQFFHFETGILYTMTSVYLGDKKIITDFIEHYTLDGFLAKNPEIKKLL